MQSIEIVLSMLLAVLASGYIARALPFSLPLPLVQIALGAAISLVSGAGVPLEPHTFFILFLPPLLFLDGWRIPREGLLRDARVILQLAFGLVLLTVIGAGFLIHWLIPTIPLAVAFALAAIVSPTDPVAVSSIAARAPIPRRLMHILEGESLLNDASGLVCFRFAVAAAMTGHFSLASASVAFLWLALGGLAIGALLVVVLQRVHVTLTRRFGQETGMPILLSLLMPFGAYLAAEELGASGILAAVAAGITMGYVEFSGNAPAVTRVHRAAVWDTVQFTLNGIMFVLLGEQLPGILRDAAASVAQSGHASAWWLLLYALALNFGLALIRFAWVWVSFRLRTVVAARRGRNLAPPHWRLVAATSLAGVRGAITLAGVLSLPLLLPDGEPFPARELVIFLATTVILLSLLAASFGLPPLLAGLKLAPEPRDERAEDRVRQLAARAAVAAVEQTQHDAPEAQVDPEVYADAASRVMALYQRRLNLPGGDPGDGAEELRKADHAERMLRLAGLRAERDAIYRLARENRVTDELARKLVREIDLIESRYR